ncbi:MAG: MarR family transcriptional regulator [Actinobacteria bacterium]|nr:MarR family transcriptional regulator [Actinomycetota bacterium]
MALTSDTDTDPPAILEVPLLALAVSGDRARQALDDALQPLRLRARHLGPLLIAAEEAPIAQNQLAERAGVDKSAMVRVVDDLHALGLVRREPVPHDRRSYWIKVTPAGRRTLRRARARIEELEDDLFFDLDSDDRRRAQQAVLRLARGVAAATSRDDGARQL